MNLPSDWPLVALAAIAAGIALLAGSYFPVSLPAGAAAIVLAALLLVGPAGRVSVRPPSGPPPAPATPLSTLRAAFRSGRSGRLSIVGDVDRLERRVVHPGLPARSVAEEEALRRMTPSDFRNYLASRLEALERGLR